ncbi:Amidohydrolase 2 [Penicillium sp. DV-2018c]|nr:Amidohydrolase 2 [Penicillium sp. DV-2018c]
MSQSQMQIVDSHIHLFPKSHLKSLTWYTETDPLASQHSINEYRTALSASSGTESSVRGFIFLETDRLSSTNPTTSPGWTHALDEVSFLTRIALGTPTEGEGHKPADKDLCLGIVPWAPVPGGPELLREYIGLVRERAGDAWGKVCGVRYLLQDKRPGTMTAAGFVDGLRWLGEEGLTFDLGVDARSGGLWQLREVVQMLDGVYGDGKGEGRQLTVVINHLCKPNLRLGVDVDISLHPEFVEWKELVTRMGGYAKTYMKLSGVDCMQPWTDVVFDAFGAGRVMFGSDWPVCNVGGGGNEVSWGRWRRVVEEVLKRRGLSEEEKKGVWGNVALKAYGIGI